MTSRNGKCRRSIAVRNSLYVAAAFWIYPGTAVSSTGAAHADSGPSFNCQKATSPVEHTICADAVLAKLDRQLALAWKALLTEFNDEHQIAAIRADQNRWLTSRNTCGANASCLQTAYGKRLSQIGGGDAAVPAAGVFEAAQIGKFALYPIGPRAVHSGCYAAN
jgi:uncharacterized protein